MLRYSIVYVNIILEADHQSWNEPKSSSLEIDIISFDQRMQNGFNVQ